MSEVLEPGVLNTQPQPEMEMQRAQPSALLSAREWEGYLAILDQEEIATTSSRLHDQLRNEWAEPFLKALLKADEYIWPDDSARENSVWRALGDSIATHQEVRSRLLSTLIQSNDASKMFDFTQVCHMVAFGMIAGLQYATADRPMPWVGTDRSPYEKNAPKVRFWHQQHAIAQAEEVLENVLNELSCEVSNDDHGHI